MKNNKATAPAALKLVTNDDEPSELPRGSTTLTFVASVKDQNTNSF